MAVDFWARVDARGLATDCHRWTGPIGSKGYGRCSYEGRSRDAHVVACELAHGPVARGLVVRHLCADISSKRLGVGPLADRLCVNPRHLRAGTQSENALDRERARRAAAGGRPQRPNPDRRWW